MANVVNSQVGKDSQSDQSTCYFDFKHYAYIQYVVLPHSDSDLKKYTCPQPSLAVFYRQEHKANCCAVYFSFVFKKQTHGRGRWNMLFVIHYPFGISKVNEGVVMYQ